MRLPNCFIVGAPKAGTTSLYHHLDQHPDIFMSPMKETCYFSAEMRRERFAPSLQPLVRDGEERLRAYLDSPPLGRRFGGIVSEWKDYCRLFEGVGDQAVVGEASPCYLWSQTAARRIASLVPTAKIIIILRNPIDRAFSQYLQMANSGDCRGGFERHLEACLANTRKDEISMLHPFLEFGLYAEQVARYMEIFPPSQIGLWLYEDTWAPGFLEGVYDYLGVDDGFVADTSTRHLEQQMPRVPGFNRILGPSKVADGLRSMFPRAGRPFLKRLIYRSRGAMRMSARERAMLAEYYGPDISRLQTLLQRDLSHWVDGAVRD
jgi:Sulfotransferase family